MPIYYVDINWLIQLAFLLSGAILGYLGSKMVANNERIRAKKALEIDYRNRFEGLAGSYECYSKPEDEKARTKFINKHGREPGNYEYDLNDGVACLKYLHDNYLEIKIWNKFHLDMGYWSGLVEMNTDQKGEISWYYHNLGGKSLKENDHEFGYKRMTYSKRSQDEFIYLVEDAYGIEPGRYRTEVLKKVSKTCSNVPM